MMTYQAKDQGHSRIYNSRNSQVNLLVLGDTCYDWHCQSTDDSGQFLTVSRRPNPNGNSIWHGQYELFKPQDYSDDQLELFEGLDSLKKALFRLPEGLPNNERQRTPIVPA